MDQGYVLRRLIRRAIRFARILGLEAAGLIEVANAVINQYKDIYNELEINADKIKKNSR